MAWYRTYRPQTVAQLAITPVREQMEQLLKTGRYAHAYLFTGPKGVGKTSTARILARILNDPQNEKKVLAGKGPLKEPDSQEALLQQIAVGGSQVVIEQDAASHRGIDDIRALQEHVSVVPTQGLVRVVILDEVHMLTNEAFNALLKLLEEPPQRVVFVLATTEPHKVPATVQSRCEQIQFRQATVVEIEQVLQNVAQEEKIELDSEVTKQLAQVAQGSFRDAIKYLESITSAGEIDTDLLENLVGSQQSALELLRALATKDASSVSEFFQQSRQQGRQFGVIEQQLFWQLQQRLHRAIARQENASTRHNILELINYLVANLEGYEPIDGLRLELACVGWCFKHEANSDDPDGKKKSLTPSIPKSSTKAAAKNVSTTVKKNPIKNKSSQKNSHPRPATVNSSTISRTQVQEAWEELLLYIRTQSQALESLLRNASLGMVQDNVIEIEFELAFHQEQLESKKYKGLLQSIFREKLHPEVELHTRLNTPIKAQEPADNAQDDEDDQLMAAVEAAVFSASEAKTKRAVN